MLRLLMSMVITIISMYSCSSGNDDSNITLLKEVNNSLLQSNRITKLSTDNTLESLENKTRRPETSERATKWFSKALVVKKLTDNIITHIERLKSGLSEEAGFNPLREEFKPAREAVHHVFNEHKEGQLLHEKLALYKWDLLAIDSTISKIMANDVLIPGIDMISKEESFTDKYFNTTLLGAITMLNKIECDIRFTENKFTVFCNEQISILSMYLDNFPISTPLVGQSATVVKPGQPITITAGIGEYSLMLKPSVKIGNTDIPINSNKFSEYELKTPSEAGDYTTLVTVQYLDPITGKMVEFKKTIKYTVLSN
ncbi:MAG TPA: hypothetical protein VHM26_07470 [Chitinophagaceae bacterium]|nr:hypothetical protein [Chitinophagaceae bacterium]